MVNNFERICAVLQKVYRGRKEQYFEKLSQKMDVHEGALIITANPETLAHAQSDEYIQILENPMTEIVADGIGLIKMAAQAGIVIEERIPGVDIMAGLLDFANKKNASVALLGAAPEVLEALLSKLSSEKPDLRLVFSADGYQVNKDILMEEIVALQPDLLFVALGIPAQEKLLYQYLPRLSHCISVGVGGSFDVLSGTKRRAPQFFVRTGTEWLYRILREPKRIKRFVVNNLIFYRSWKNACQKQQ